MSKISINIWSWKFGLSTGPKGSHFLCHTFLSKIKSLKSCGLKCYINRNFAQKSAIPKNVTPLINHTRIENLPKKCDVNMFFSFFVKFYQPKVETNFDDPKGHTFCVTLFWAKFLFIYIVVKVWSVNWIQRVTPYTSHFLEQNFY